MRCRVEVAELAIEPVMEVDWVLTNSRQCVACFSILSVDHARRQASHVQSRKGFMAA